MPLKLITLNIEAHKHLDRFLPVLQKEQPDVVCLQELLAADVERIARELQMESVFVPLARVDQENQYEIAPLGEWGVGLFTHLQHAQPQVIYYKGEGTTPPFTTPNSIDRALLVTEVTKDGQQFRVATTHFTWSGKGEYTEEQNHDFQSLTQIIQQFDSLILAGDFNAPRGRELFAAFSELLTDNLPAHYTTTIDPDLHYAGALELVVDTIFSTPPYRVENVRLVRGVSDHQAVVGEISRA